MISTDISLTMHHEPFEFYVGDGLLDASQLADLNANLPDRSIYSREIKKGTEHRKQYRMWRCEPGLNGQRTHVADQLTSVWSDLVDSALSNEFRGWLSECVKIDLSICPLSAGLYVFQDGDYTTTDTGKLEKALTMGFYLNEHWSESFGGRFQTFEDKNSPAPTSELLPIGGRCVAWTPTQSSWHRIQTIDTGGSVERLLMMLEFWRP